jgi:thiol:disulfide interchange protein
MIYRFVLGLAALWLAGLANFPLAAQETRPAKSQNPFEPGGRAAQEEKGSPLRLNLPGEFNFGVDAASGDVQLSAGFQVVERTGEGKLYVTAEVSPGWHIYSLTQKPGGPLKSELRVTPSSRFELGAFEPDVAPKVHKVPEFTALVEEHEGTVTWSAPLKLADGTKPEELVINITYSGQVCQDGGACIPLNRKLVAKFAGYLQPAGTPGEYRPRSSRVTWRGHIEPKVVAPGSKARLVLTATPDEKWHLYPYKPRVEEGEVSQPTLVVLSNAGGWKQSGVTASKEPKSAPPAGPGQVAQRYYEGEVTFTIDLVVPPSAAPGSRTLTGFLGFQTCDAKSCIPAEGAKFTVTVPVAAAEQPGQLALLFEQASYNHVKRIADQQPLRSDMVDPFTLALQLALSLVGGLLLNLMPCVLPVLGLKIMSFVKQGGQSRGQIISLNLAYTAGLMAVFLLLATLAAFLNLGWGEQMTRLWFRVTMLVLMFAFGLSFLGVWEMTIPGLANSEIVHATEGREGMAGAFFKGVFTTILGVSCSGPFLGGVFGYTLTQPWWVTYLIFTFVGLGMASPFLLIGAFPRLLSILPKPGEWMNTFKHLMGFVMLGVTIWVFSTLGAKNYIPALLLLLGVGFALWWIGRVPIYEDTGKQIKAWLVGAAIAGAAAFITFGGRTILGPWYPGPVEEIYQWQPYSDAALNKYRSEGKVVMIDFTADWCVNCQTNFRWAINREAVKELITRHRVVPMKADWTDQNETIKSKLAELNSISIPLLAIYPAGKPEEDVIILRDLVTQQQVLEALKKAGPSKDAAPPAEDSKARVAKVSSSG